MKTFKKIALLSLIISMLIVSLISCGNNQNSGTETTVSDSDYMKDTTTIRIAVLNGTTGFGIAPLNEKLKSGSLDAFKAEIDFYADPSLISPLIISKSADIAAIPTNLSSVLYNKTNGGIKIIAVSTGGVLYILNCQTAISGTAESNSEIVKYETIESLKGMSISVPGQGSNPEYVLQAILNKKGLGDSVKIDYSFTSPDELASGFAAGKTSFALLPEPKASIVEDKLTSVSSVNRTIQRIDISKEWKEATGTDLVQGCFVVRTEFLEQHKGLVNAFIDEYRKTLEESLSSDFNEAVFSSGLIPNKAIMTDALIERCKLVCITGEDMVSPLNTYFTALYDVTPAAVGGKVPDSNIYYTETQKTDK